MLLSPSPPVFSHSPPTGFLSQNYNTIHDSLTRVNKLQRATSFSNKNLSKRLTTPKRSILVVRTTEETFSYDEPISPNKIKKKVVFADDQGKSLTHIRLMTEPSNVPPLWSQRFLAEVTLGLSAEPVDSNNNWEITFPQPASDYIRFRQKIEIQNVCLENVIIKENKNQILGTVKVTNLSYEKKVIVRFSCDKWVTYEDHICSYVPSSSGTSAYILYDTFTFEMNLPKESKRFDFCLCYKTNETEYWDNNNNNNYLILKKLDQNGNSNFEPNFNVQTDALYTKIDSWSEFASWTHLQNSSPYW